MEPSPARVVALYREAARVMPSVIGKDHLLVKQRNNYYVIQLLEHGGQNIIALKARLTAFYKSSCDAYEVKGSAAVSGYGPLVYDAVMEALSPRWMAPDRTYVSKEASRVWKHYYEHRSDVEHVENGDKCQDSKKGPWLNYLYRKKSGSLAQHFIPFADLGTHPMVVKHLGGPVEVTMQRDGWSGWWGDTFAQWPHERI